MPPRIRHELLLPGPNAHVRCTSEATGSELPPPEVVASGLSLEAFTGELRQVPMPFRPE